MTKESDSNLQTILDSVGAAIITIDERGLILSANRNTTTLFGYPLESMQGNNVMMLMPEPYRSEHDGYLERHLRTGENRIIGSGRRVSGRRADGSTFLMHLSVAKYREKGEIRFVGIVHDLSELDRSQISNARLGRIVDESVNEVFVFNASDLRFTMVNRGALSNLGYSLPEMLSMTPLSVKPLYNKESFHQLVEPLLNGSTERIHFETVHQRKDGSRYDVEIDLNLSDSVEPAEFIAIIQDVTDRNRIRELHQRAQRLQSIGNLTGGIAHDFNNLLTVISGNLELLQTSLHESDQLELLGDAQNAAQMGARLTHRLLVFASKGRLSPSSINLNNLVLDLTDLLRRTLGESISLDSKLDPQLWAAMVDISELENALINLAINARDAMPEGGKLAIETSNVSIVQEPLPALDITPGDYIKISVVDTGCGIPHELQASVFEPFVTTKTGPHGTGLGLSMVYGFARQSGGGVTLYSEPGSGSTFTLYLPRDLSTTDKLEQSQRISPTVTQQHVVKILVAEDADAVRKLTVKRLQTMGHTVVEAADGYAALDIYRQQPDFDLVFTDMVMTAGMTGYDLALAIRTVNPSARILMTSGYAEDVINPDKLAENGFELLRKPYQQSELADAIVRTIKE